MPKQEQEEDKGEGQTVWDEPRNHPSVLPEASEMPLEDLKLQSDGIWITEA